MRKDEMNRDARRMALIEAALYAAGRPLELKTLARIAGTRSENVVLRLIGGLARRYEEEGSALEIKELPGSRFVLQLRPTYTEKVRRLANKPLLSRGPLKTLSFIAYYQPIEQGKVIEARGRHVYSHLKRLEEMGLITRERVNGKGTIIRTTPYFADYFGFSHNPHRVKVQLRRLFEQLKIQKIENLKNNGNGQKRHKPLLGKKASVLTGSWDKPVEKTLLPQDFDDS